MPRTNLRAVKPGETVKPAAPLSVAEAAETGDRRRLLLAMRDRVAVTVSDPLCPPRDLAALTRRLTEIAKELEALDLAAKQEAEQGGEVADEPFDASAI